MDGRIGHATTSYSATYSQPSYPTPHVSNFSAPYATVDVHNSAPHLHGHSRISENFTGTHVPSSNTVAYNAYSMQFENFGNTHESLPKESESIAEQSLPEAVVAALKKSLAQNKRISALCLEQYEKGLFPDYAAIKARVLQEDETSSIDSIGERAYGYTAVHTPPPSTAAYYTPPTQLQNFGNTNTSLPKDPKSIGGQTNLERAEIERGVKALRDRVQVLRQERIDRELAQRKEALPIDITGEKNDDSETKSASVEKAESSSIYSESIKSKEANIVENGHEKYSKTTILDFF